MASGCGERAHAAADRDHLRDEGLHEVSRGLLLPQDQLHPVFGQLRFHELDEPEFRVVDGEEVGEEREGVGVDDDRL